MGEIGARLSLGSGIVIDEIAWTLSNSAPPAGFSSPRTGTFDVSGAGTTFTQVISDVPAGSGYDLTFTAKSPDNKWVCAGHAMPAPFAVLAGNTTLTSVHLSCQNTEPKTGSVLVGGDANICPVVDDLAALPLSAAIGASITLTATGGDADMAPSALTYSITLSATQPSGAGAGTLQNVNPATHSASLRCDAQGPVSITVSVSDGDVLCAPASSVQALVQCTDACLHVVCAAPNQCHTVGVCDHATGACSYPNAANGITCNDGDSATLGDICTGGACAGFECLSATDCPGTDGECRFRACNAGTCGFANAAAGTLSSTQVAADCDKVQCNGSGNYVSVADNTDLPNDNNQCTSDLCASGAPSFVNVAYGTPCSQDGGQFCNASGACILPTFRVVRVGTGTGALTTGATATFVDEYTQTGTLVGSVALPTTVSGANRILMLAGTDPSHGGLSLSGDGHFVVLAGYDAVTGTVPVTGLNASVAANVNRIVGRIDASGNIDTTTRFTSAFNIAAVRGAATNDGTGFWVAGAGATPTGGTSTGGVWYLALGGSGGTQLSSTILMRWLNVFSGQLFGSSNAGPNLFTIGTALPTTGPQTLTSLPANYPNSATGQSPYGFVLLDMNPAVAGNDTLYVADDTTGGIKKWTLNGAGSWSLSTTSFTTVATGTSPANFRGLTAVASGSTVTLIAGTAVASGSDRLVKFVDDGTSTSPVGSVIVTAGTNRAFRGLAMSPH